MSRGSLSICVIATVILFEACKSPKDPAVTFNELTILANRLSSGTHRYDWNDVELVKDISPDTLVFLNQSFDEQQIQGALKTSQEPFKILGFNISDKPTCDPIVFKYQTSLLKKFRARLKPIEKVSYLLPASTCLALKQDEPPTLPSGVFNPEIQKLLNEAYPKIPEENYDVTPPGHDPRDRMSIWCNKHCGCIAKSLGDALRARFPGRKLLYLKVEGGGKPKKNIVSSHSFVQPLVPGFENSFWGHHVVLLIEGDQGGWGIVDPLVFKDATIRSPTAWYSAFEHASEGLEKYCVSPSPLF